MRRDPIIGGLALLALAALASAPARAEALERLVIVPKALATCDSGPAERRPATLVWTSELLIPANGTVEIEDPASGETPAVLPVGRDSPISVERTLRVDGLEAKITAEGHGSATVSRNRVVVRYELRKSDRWPNGAALDYAASIEETYAVDALTGACELKSGAAQIRLTQGGKILDDRVCTAIAQPCTLERRGGAAVVAAPEAGGSVETRGADTTPEADPATASPDENGKGGGDAEHCFSFNGQELCE